MAVPGSNVIDLVHDLLRKRKTTDSIGWQHFANQMSAANIPMELVRIKRCQETTHAETKTDTKAGIEVNLTDPEYRHFLEGG